MSSTPDIRAQFSGRSLGIEESLLEYGTQSFRFRALNIGQLQMTKQESAAIRASWKALNALSRIRQKFNSSKNPS